MKTKESPRIIKRYSNRKLYDTFESRYVTLDQIANMVKNREELRIIDNNNGNDLTEVTLAQIIFEEQKKQSIRMPLELLQEAIRSGGSAFTEFLKRHATPSVQIIKEEVERKVDHFIHKSETTVEDATRQARDYFTMAQRSLDDLLVKLDERFHTVVDSASSFGFIKEQLSTLKMKIEELESKIRNK